MGCQQKFSCNVTHQIPYLVPRGRARKKVVFPDATVWCFELGGVITRGPLGYIPKPCHSAA